MYAHARATLDEETETLIVFPLKTVFIATNRVFYGLHEVRNILTQQLLTISRKYMQHGSSLVYIDDTLLLPNINFEMIQLNKNWNKIVLREIENLPLNFFHFSYCRVQLSWKRIWSNTSIWTQGRYSHKYTSPTTKIWNFANY